MDDKAVEYLLKEFKYKKPHYLNYTLLQLHHKREEVIKEYLKVRDSLAELELSIALRACPFHLGQVVTYTKFGEVENEVYTVLIVGVEYTFLDPYYRVYIRRYDHKSGYIGNKLIRVKNLSHIIGANKVQTDDVISYEDRLKEIESYLYIPNGLSVDKFYSQVVASRERGDQLATLSPLVMNWLKLTAKV